MATPDIRVRLTPEGVKEVVAALKGVQAQANKVSRDAGGGLNAISTAAIKLKALLPALGLTAVTAGVSALAKASLNTADAVGKLAQSVGATAEGVSTLQYAAKTADVTNEQLGSGLTRLAVSLGNLERGVKLSVDSFQRLGLSAEDFAGKDTVQAFDLVAQRIGKIGDSTRKTELAVQIFGRAGAQLIPLLNDLAANGFGSVEEAARSLGLVIDTETANTAAALNDSFTLIRAQVEGLALQFTAGLAPSILEVMTGFREETAGKGVDSIRTFGTEVGRVLRTVIATFRLFYDVVSGIFRGLGSTIAQFSAAAGQIAQGNFSEAVNIWRDNDQTRANYEQWKERIKRDWTRIVDEATKDVAPASAAIRRAGQAVGAADEAAAAAAAAAARKASADALRAEREAERLADQRRRAEETAARTRFDIEQRLLELTGQQREARLRALDEEIAKQRQLLAEAGGITGADEQRFSRIRAIEAARIDFEETYERAQQAMEALAAQRLRIQQDVELGITTELEGQRQIATIEAERLPIMQEIANAAMTAAQASGDPALIAQAEQLNLALGQVAISVAKARDEFAQFREQATSAIQSDLSNFFFDAISGAKSLEDAFKSLAKSVVASLQRIAAEIIAQQIIRQITGLIGGFGGGGQLAPITVSAQRIPGYASGGSIDATSGGLIRGPGTGTSDSIPAITTSGRALLVSNGEYIVNARAASRPGVMQLLQSLNGGLPVLSPPRSQFRFASGGMIRDGGVAGMVVNQQFNVAAPAGTVSRATEQQIAAAAARGLAQASRRNN